MLEIEQQFPFSPELFATLENKLSAPTTKELDEVYFDDDRFSLLKNDTWLRKRNGKFELKYRKPENRGLQLEVYEEFTSEDDIKDFLNVAQSIQLAVWINEQLRPIIEIETTRHTFKKGNLTIDVDITNFGYNVCEIEYVGEATREEAQNEIDTLANELGLRNDVVKNKAKAYVEMTYPELSEMLRELKVL